MKKFLLLAVLTSPVFADVSDDPGGRTPSETVLGTTHGDGKNPKDCPMPPGAFDFFIWLSGKIHK